MHNTAIVAGAGTQQAGQVASTVPAAAKFADDGRFRGSLESSVVAGLVPEWEKRPGAFPGVVARPAGRGTSDDATAPDRLEPRPAARASVGSGSGGSLIADAAAKKAVPKEAAKTPAKASASAGAKAASSNPTDAGAVEAAPALVPEIPQATVAATPVPVPEAKPELTASPDPQSGAVVEMPAKASKAPVDAGATRPAAKKLDKGDAIAVGEQPAPAAGGIALATPAAGLVAGLSSAAGAAGAASAVAVHGAHGVGSAASAAPAKIAEATPSSAVAEAHAAHTDLKTLVATPNVLEIGVAGGSHGWLRVRAELGQAGEVTASVAASSAGAVEGLHKELPAISAYLAGERVGVSSLVVNEMGKGAAAQDAAMNNGAGSQTSTNAGTNSGTSQHAQDSTPGKAQTGNGIGEVSDAGTGFDFEWAGEDLPAAALANGSGSWLSVRV